MAVFYGFPQPIRLLTETLMYEIYHVELQKTKFQRPKYHDLLFFCQLRILERVDLTMTFSEWF